jgi:hypothetical protein
VQTIPLLERGMDTEGESQLSQQFMRWELRPLASLAHSAFVCKVSNDSIGIWDRSVIESIDCPGQGTGSIHSGLPSPIRLSAI